MDEHAEKAIGDMKSTPAIGVVLPASLELARQILRGVRQYCNSHPPLRLDLISATGNLKYYPESYRNSSRKCVVAQALDTESLDKVRKLSPHVVLTTNRTPFQGIPCVLNDDVSVGRMGAEYLFSLGYRTLAFLSRSDMNFSVERAKGFGDFAQAKKIPCHLLEDWEPATLDAVLELLLSLREPVGLMAASDLFARWFLEAMEKPGKWIPHRIGVLGVDEDSLEQSLSPMGFSSIRLSGERLGFEAASLEMRLAAGEPPPDKPLLIAPDRVVARRSTSNFVVRDPLVARALQMIEDRMPELGDAGDLVKALQAPRRTVEDRFRKSLGSTPARELLRARLARARMLLGTTELSIKEIAYLIGFSEPRMLSLVFKRETGESPVAYRKRVKPGSIL